MLAVSYLACSGNILWIWDSSTIYVYTMYAYNICAYILMIWNVREERGERGERDSRHTPAQRMQLKGRRSQYALKLMQLKEKGTTGVLSSDTA